MLIAEDIQVEWDEGGCFLSVDGERWLVSDPEKLYDQAKAAILPWLMEREEARRTMPVPGFGENVFSDESGYDRDDPKHPDFHSIHADIWDMREGK